MTKIINGIEIRDMIKESLVKEISLIEDELKLVVIQVGNDSASDIYVNNKKKLCQDVGISFKHIKYEDSSTEELISLINDLNKDEFVTGILVQLPLPKNIDSSRVIESIDYKKDVDGLTSKNIGNLYVNKRGIIPCTAYGVMKIFEYEKIDLTGKNVVVIGRSKLVGIPLIALLLRENATVTVCHTRTKDLSSKALNADIVIVAAGCKDLITSDMVSRDAIIIDVGINRVDGKIYGDVNNEVKDYCNMITPVPGGVGPLTVIMLVNNVIECYKIQKESLD